MTPITQAARLVIGRFAEMAARSDSSHGFYQESLMNNAVADPRDCPITAMQWIKILLVLTLLTLMTFLALFVVGYFLLDSTVSASGYSEWRFWQVSMGDREEDVLKALGEPLRVAPNDNPELTLYYGPPELEVGDEGGISSSARTQVWAGSFDGYTQVTVDPSNRIVAIDGNYLANASDWIGRELPAFVEAYGPPRGSVDWLSVKYLSYTKPGDSGHYHVRSLGFDREGKVRQRIAYWYFD